jgi:hypothetical protein
MMPATFGTVDGAGGRGGDAVDVADVEGQRDLRVEALAGGGNAQLAEVCGELAGERETVDVVVDKRVGQRVDVVDCGCRGGYGVGPCGERGVAIERGARLGGHGVVDHVVERSADRGGLVGDDVGHDLKLVVLVGPAQLVGDACGRDYLHALCDDRRGGDLGTALLRALRNYLGLGCRVEHDVGGVGERLRGAGGQRRDGGGVLCLVDDGGHYLVRELDLAGVVSHFGSLLVSSCYRGAGA